MAGLLKVLLLMRPSAVRGKLQRRQALIYVVTSVAPRLGSQRLLLSEGNIEARISTSTRVSVISIL